MPDDESDERWPDEAIEGDDPTVAHDDIMKRLLNYQRSLREGASPAEAAEAAEVAVEPPLDGPAAPDDVLDLSATKLGMQVDVDASGQVEPALEVAPEPEPLEVAPGPELFEVAPEPEPVADAMPEPNPEPEPEPLAEPEPGWISEAVPHLASESAPEPEPEAPAISFESKAELEARVQRLEERLERLGSKVGALRQSFQDMAIAADERLAAMEDEIGQVKSEHDEG